MNFYFICGRLTQRKHRSENNSFYISKLVILCPQFYDYSEKKNHQYADYDLKKIQNDYKILLNDFLQ